MHRNLWLRVLARRLFLRPSSSSAKRRAAPMPPRLEFLEDRTTPAVLTVGPGQEYSMPSQAAAAAHDGDTVEIFSNGNYNGDTCHWTQNNLTIEGVGGGRAHIDDTGKTVYGGKAIWLISGTNTTVNNIEFSGAHDTINSDDNWAGIKLEGNTLTLNNDYFHNNDDGVLVAATNTNLGSVSNVVIDGSEFANNGYGDGQSHNMYIGQVNSFTLENSYSHDANEGHLVKSRALTNYILYNRLQDGAAPTSTASYELDLPQGGLSYVIGNIIEQGPYSANHTIISYSEEGTKNPSQNLYLVNNTIVNDYSGSSTFLALPDASSSALIENNIFCGSGTLISGTGSTTQITNLVSNTPGFVNQADYDYHLTAGSGAINAGTAPGTVNGFDLTPTSEYVDQLGLQPRPVNGAIDIGAFEYVPSTTTPTIITVNDSSGGMDNPANVTVATLGSNVTLRDAINAANNTSATSGGSYLINLPEGNTITFTSPVNNTTITSNNTVQNQNWYGPNALPAITSNITIEGNNDTLQIATGSDMRFFYVSGGPTLTGGALALGTLELDNLTLEGGLARGDNGSGGGLGAGGAIFNQGNLTLNGDTLTNNQAIGGKGGFSGGGGGMGPGGDQGSVVGGGVGGYFSITDGPQGGKGASGGNAGGGAGFTNTANGGNASTTQSGAGGGLGGFGGAGGGPTGGAAGDGGGGGSWYGSVPEGGGFGFGGGGWGGGGGIGGGGGGYVFHSGSHNSRGGGGGFGGGGGSGLFGGDGGFGGGGGTGSYTGGGIGGLGGFGGGPGGGGGAGMGGGIFNMFGTLTISNSTLSDNAAKGGASGDNNAEGGSGLGGALFNLDGNATLTGVHFANNNAVVASGAALAQANGSSVYNLAYGNYITTGGPTTASTILRNTDVIAGNGGNALVNDAETLTKNPNTAVFNTYDAQGRLTGVYYPNGNVYLRTYTSSGSTATLTNSSIGTISYGVTSEDYTYDTSGQLTQRVVNYTNGNVLTFSYTNGVVSSGTLENPNTGTISSGVSYEDFTYDSSGQLSQLLVKYTNGNVLKLNYTNGLRSSGTLTNPTSGTVASGVASDDYTYDTKGQISQLVVNYTNGNVLKLNYTNGIASSGTLTNPTSGTVASGIASDDYTYDTSGKLSQLVVNYTNGNILNFTYTSGVRSSGTLKDSNGNTLDAYTYDSSGQLSTLIVYQSNGDVLTFTYTNGVRSSGTITDSNNNTLQKQTYDASGRLTKVVYYTNNSPNGNVYNRTYNSDGTSYATLTNSSGTVLDYYEYDAQGNLTYGPSSTPPSGGWPPQG